MNKTIINKDGSISVKVEGVYVRGNGQYLVTPYKKDKSSGISSSEEENERVSYFGSFGFNDPDAAKETMREAVDSLSDFGFEDTVFNGEYPKYKKDNYGVELKVNNRVKFYTDFSEKEEVPVEDLSEHVYSVEILFKGFHSDKRDKNEILMRVIRCFATEERNSFEKNDELFKEEKETFQME